MIKKITEEENDVLKRAALALFESLAVMTAITSDYPDLAKHLESAGEAMFEFCEKMQSLQEEDVSH